VPPGETYQFGHVLRDEGRGLLRAALPAQFIVARAPVLAWRLSLPASLGSSQQPTSNPANKPDVPPSERNSGMVFYN
jgi:hypothetical protein